MAQRDEGARARVTRSVLPVVVSGYQVSVIKRSFLSDRLNSCFRSLFPVIRMGSDDGSLFGLGRGSLTAIGAIMVVIGLVLFLVAATSVMTPTSNQFDFAAREAQMNSSFVTAIIGMVLLALGFGALRLGMIRPVTTYVASEASPAIERVSEAAGEGLRIGFGGNPLRSESVVKVKCRNCGYLENEDAIYCGKCGKPL